MTKPVVEGFCDSEFSELESIFAKAIQSGFDDGAGFALEVDGKEVLNLWGGFSDKAHQKPWQQDTLVNVFSVTKAMTSTCALQLIESGKLNPNALVADYWPEYACAGKENTKVIDFLTHRAGMFGFQSPLPKDSWENWDMIVDKLARQEPIREPGTTQGYHAVTFGYLVGELVRRIDGRSLGTYFKEEIAEKFGIDFVIGMNEEDISRCADLLLLSGKPNLLIQMVLALPNWLARRMFEGLKQFIALDIPFRAGERTERLSFIQAALDNPVVSPAEKLRQVLDGYAVESEYGRKIDTYKDTILIDDQERDVNILRIGRLVLAYQTSDLSETGIYNKDTQSWEPLPGRYRNSIRDGIAMAKKVKTVDILELPVPAAEVAQ